MDQLIALDWGTTALRAYLLGADGEVRDARAEPWGIMHVPNGDFAAAFAAIVDGWRARGDVPAIAAGMIGSAQGWRQVPYVPCPAGVDELAAALERVDGVYIAPGVARRDDPRPDDPRRDDSQRPPDMMRGEETQVVGALALRPTLARRSTLVLPGTHAKWVDVVDGRMRDVATYVTGELFAALRDGTILGRAARDAGPVDEDVFVDAFTRGVCAARDASGGIAPLLFSVRSLVLADRLPAAASLPYLSGLLIGDELRSALGEGHRPSALLGERALCARYAAALMLFGIPGVPVVDGTAPAGLWAVAQRAGLVDSPAAPRQEMAVRSPSLRSG